MEMHSYTVFHLTSQLQLDAVMAFSYPLHGWEQENVTIQDVMKIEGLDLIFDDCFCIGDYIGGAFDEGKGPVVEELAMFLAKQIPDMPFSCHSSYCEFSGGEEREYDIKYRDHILRIGEKDDGGNNYIPDGTKVLFDDPYSFRYLFKGNGAFDDLVTGLRQVKTLDKKPKYIVCSAYGANSETVISACQKGIHAIIEEDFIKSRSFGDESELEEAGIDEGTLDDIFRLSLDYKPFIYRHIIV